MENILDTTYGDISKKACLAQMRMADKRGIRFRFCYADWIEWWIAELNKIGPGSQRGKKRHQYVMARYGDQGAYEPGNVYAAHPSDNSADRSDLSWEIAAAKATETRNANGNPRGIHLRVRGDGHPKSKAVITPDGRFGSLALAGEYYGITRQGAGNRVRNGTWKLA
jgi:hypothetical protein